MQKVDNFTDDRGILMWANQKIIGFDYKYLTIGTMKPGSVRGGHYHKRIFEKFLCISGKLKIILESEHYTVNLDMEPGDICDIPTETVHTIENIGKETASFLEFKSEDFDENDNDTFKRE